MPVNFGKYRFEGPFASTKQLYDKPAVYIVVCKDFAGNFLFVDIGESEKVRSCVENPDKLVGWTKICRGNGTLNVGVLYTEGMLQPDRLKIASEIDAMYKK